MIERRRRDVQRRSQGIAQRNHHQHSEPDAVRRSDEPVAVEHDERLIRKQEREQPQGGVQAGNPEGAPMRVQGQEHQQREAAVEMDECSVAGEPGEVNGNDREQQ